MELRVKHLIKRHFVAAAVVFAILAFPVRSHGWWFQIKFLFFTPVLLLHSLMPETLFQRHSEFYYVGTALSMLVAFLYTWLIVYAFAKAYAHLRKRR